MKKLTNSEKLALLTFIAGKAPADYSQGGWNTFINSDFHTAVNKLLSDAEKIPAKETVEATSASINDRLDSKFVAPQVNQDGEAYLLTDEMVAQARSPEKLWERTLDAIKGQILPACYSTMSHSVEHYLEDKFFYTTGTSKHVAYFRNLNKEGNVWVEATDSEKPFSSLHGKIKNELNAVMCLHSGERCVLVLREAADGRVYTEQKNLADLYREKGKEILSRIQKTEKGTAYNFFVAKMSEEIEALKQSWDGHKTKFSQSLGLANLPDAYDELDEHLTFFEQFYRTESDIVTFTNDPNERAFNYFDLHNLKEGPTPGFDMFMSGVDEASRDTMMAAIYATFDSRCHLNQYIWIHGEGGDGKSSLLMAMAEYAGDSMYCALSTDSAKSEFGLEECVGKRLVMFPDIQSGLSVKSGLVHKLTGHDLISINRKNKPHISTHIDCILWMASNSAPDVNFSNKNEARRCVYIKMHEPPIEIQKKIYFLNEDGSFQLDAEGNKINNGFPLKKMLIDEMPAILFKCRKVFEERVKAPYSVIRLTTAESKIASDNCSDLDDDQLTYYIDKTFTFTQDENDRIAQPEITNAVNLTLKCDNLPNMDSTMKRKLFRKLDNFFKCPQTKSHGVKYRTGLKIKED